MDTRKTVLDVLTVCQQALTDFKPHHIDKERKANSFILTAGASINSTFYPTGFDMASRPLQQTYFYRAMSNKDAYEWCQWLKDPANTDFPLNRDEPLCLASFAGYSFDYLKSNWVVIEFFAPGFTSSIFDFDKSKHKFFGLKGENNDFSWGLSNRPQMAHDASPQCKELTRQLPQIFKDSINQGGNFRVVAYRLESSIQVQ